MSFVVRLVSGTGVCSTASRRLSKAGPERARACFFSGQARHGGGDPPTAADEKPRSSQLLRLVNAARSVDVSKRPRSAAVWVEKMQKAQRHEYSPAYINVKRASCLNRLLPRSESRSEVTVGE